MGDPPFPGWPGVQPRRSPKFARRAPRLARRSSWLARRSLVVSWVAKRTPGWLGDPPGWPRGDPPGWPGDAPPWPGSPVGQEIPLVGHEEIPLVGQEIPLVGHEEVS